MPKDFILKRTLLALLELQVVILLFGLVLNANSKIVDKDEDGNLKKIEITPTLPSDLWKSKQKPITTEEDDLFFLPYAAASTSSGNNNTKPCNATDLDVCWSKLPPLDEPGIPSTPAAVESACKAFETGMECVDKWAKQCLGKAAQEKLKTSITGAHETFTFICKDAKFRAEYLSHAACYRKISPLWDDCSRRFIESLKRLDGNNQQPIKICCIRLRFLQCVTEVAHLHCTHDAEKFLQAMAETLVRSTMRSHVPIECRSVTHANCSDASGCSTLKPSSSSLFVLFPSLKILLSHYINEIGALPAYLFPDIYNNDFFSSFNSFKTLSDWVVKKFPLGVLGSF